MYTLSYNHQQSAAEQSRIDPIIRCRSGSGGFYGCRYREERRAVRLNRGGLKIQVGQQTIVDLVVAIRARAFRLLLRKWVCKSYGCQSGDENCNEIHLGSGRSRCRISAAPARERWTSAKDLMLGHYCKGVVWRWPQLVHIRWPDCDMANALPGM